MKLDKVIAERATKTVYREGNTTVKLFNKDFPKAEVLAQAKNQALVAAGFGGIIGGITVAIVSNAFAGLALIAAALFCAGLAIFLFFGCLSATVGSAILTKNTFIGIKNLIVRKEKI